MRLFSNSIPQVCRLLACSPLVILPTVSQAQTSDDDVITIADFIVVGATQGYLASVSNTGTRLNQNIKELPIPVEIVTRDFIEDTGALTVAEALQFTAGLETNITTTGQGENFDRRGSTAFRLRGFVSQTALRNGFRREGTADTINIAQVDVVRGPNALLYGIGNFGGVVNYVTAEPVFDDFRHSVGLTVGSWGLLRTTYDVTGPLIRGSEPNTGVAFRLPILYQEREDWFDHFSERKRGIAPILSWRPTANTRISFEFERYETTDTAPENPLSNVMTAPLVRSFITDTPAFGIDQELGFLRYPSDSFRYSGPGTNRKQTDTGYLLNLTHSFTDRLVVNAGYYYSTRERNDDTIAVTLAGSGIPGLGQATDLGRDNSRLYPWAFNEMHPMYSEWFAEGGAALGYIPTFSNQKRTREQARLEFAWRPTAFGLDHTFIGGATYDKMTQGSAGFRLIDRNETAAKGPLAIQSATTARFSDLRSAPVRYHSIFNYDPIVRELLPGQEFVNTSDFRDAFIHWARGYYLIHQTSFWDNRIRSILGLRYDTYQIGADGTPFSVQESIAAVGDTSLVGTLKDNIRRQNKVTDVNYSIGISYTPHERVSMFALTASALDPEITGGQTILTGFVPDPQKGQSFEFGLKTDMMDGRISGSVSVYRINRENVVVQPGGARSTPPQGIHDETTIGQAGSNYDPDWAERDGRGNWGDRALRKDSSQGLDAQFFFVNFIPGFETIVSFSYNKYSIRDHIIFEFLGKQPDGQFAFEEVSLMQRAEAEGTLPPWPQNRLNNDTPQYTFRLWNKYTFRDGPLDGFDIGLGISWSDRREADFGWDQQPSFKLVPDRTTVNVAAGYSRSIAGIDWTLRLNVNNLLNDDKLYGYSFTTPRSYRLSVSARF